MSLIYYYQKLSHAFTPVLCVGLLAALMPVWAASQPADAPADPNQASSSNTPVDSPETAEQSSKVEEPDPFNLTASSLVLIQEAYDRILCPELITEDGRVDYATLRRKRSDIMTAAKELETLNPALLMSLSKEDRMAFWMNTYNVCTIKLIIDNYPIEPKWYMILYPDNSIMQIPGAWSKIYFNIQKLEYSLKEIEQDFLLKRYKDPRICFALSYASIGGATLRNEPYQGAQLDKQLNDQVMRFLGSEKGLKIDKQNNILYLSNVFLMHRDTFLESEFASVLKFRNRKTEERAWLNFILPYLTQEDAYYLEKTDFSIKFIQYDWLLNQMN